MKILVTGATGFIAAEIVSMLLARGHDVTCCVRETAYCQQIFPQATVISCDFAKDTSQALWQERVREAEVVINCVGILYHPDPKKIWRIHFETPKALFDACVEEGVQSILQISALGVDKTNVEFAASKKAADDYVVSLPIHAIVLRPSLVYGVGSYGGTSLFRGLAALPFILPVVGKGEQKFQAIHSQDFAKAAVALIEKPPENNQIFSAVGPQEVTLEKVLVTLRAWLGLKPAWVIRVPLCVIRVGSLLGSGLPQSIMNPSTFKMLLQDNVATFEDSKLFFKQVGFIPRTFEQGIYSQPSAVQDRWHARLYFAKPILVFSLAFLWLYTAACSLFLFPQEQSFQLLGQVGVLPKWQPLFLYGAAFLDAFIGVTLLLNYQLRRIIFFQIGIIFIYSFIITWKIPSWWIHPFAPVAKNIPIVASLFVLLGMESNR